MTAGIEVRPATADDVWATSRAHRKMLPMGMFPALGERFLRQWHRTVIDTPHGVLLVAVDTGDSSYGGFLIGSTDHHAHTDALLREWRACIALACTGFVSLVVRPRVAVRFLRSRALPWSRRIFRTFWPRSSSRHEEASPRTGVLDGIAVFPGFREHGVGKALVGEFLNQCEADGVSAAELVTDVRNTSAVKFYELLDWEPVGEFVTSDGDPIRLYRYVLNGRGGIAYRQQG